MAIGKGNLGGKNPMKDWQKPTSAYSGNQGGIVTNLIGSVVGSGWIISLHTSGTELDVALTVDGVPYLGDNSASEVISVFGTLMIMKRYETGFTYYSETINSNMVIYAEGDKFEDAVMKILTDIGTIVAGTTLLNVVGEGWFYGGYVRSKGFTLNIDGVDVVLNKNSNWLNTIVKFKNSLTIKSSVADARQSFHYTLLP